MQLKNFIRISEKIFIHHHTEVMRILKNKGYHLTLISVGAYEVIKLASKDLGMADAIATELEIKNGLYTGQIKTKLHSPKGKAETLNKRYASSLKEIIALGDSAHDVSMLEKATIPIALNPTEELKRIAQEQSWQICTHKNIINYIKNL